MHKKNYQKYLTAILYAVEVPIGVWAGFEFGVSNYIFGGALTVAMMIIEICAVVSWMNAQTIELEDELEDGMGWPRRSRIRKGKRKR